MKHTEEDPWGNVPLAEKSRTEFGITLPDLPEPDGFDLEEYLDSIEGAIRGIPKWTVDHDRIVLGFFSFSKLLMYRDLDPEIWPVSDKPEEHSIIASLLHEGFSESAPSINDGEHWGQYLPPSQVNHVVDADSSQALALVDVNDGRNLVVQGPPGTGKSQTITNVIAEALGHGRTVLFVSGKWPPWRWSSAVLTA